MRITKLMTLLIISSHLCTFTQEEPIVADESTEQEFIEQQESTPEIAEESPEAVSSEQTETVSDEKPVIEEELPAEPRKEVELEPSSPETTEPQPFEIPAVPEPTVDMDTTIPQETTTESPIGIDTVSLEDPQGNWLFKRIWWERAEERYEKIRLIVDAIWESRTIFFIKRNELDRNVLDPFYLSVGVGQGELQIILSELNDFFEKQREQQGALTEQERELYETLVTEQESLKQLKMDVESIANLDHAIDDALGTLMEQINRVRQLEKQAWENFKEIAHVLNDTKARELYYHIEGAARNIKNINTYLEQSFLNHFVKLIDEAAGHVARVHNHIQALKEKGVTFKRQAEQLALQQKEQEAQRAQEEDESDEEEDRPKPKTGLINWIMSGVTTVFSYIFSVIRLPYDLIFGAR